MPALDDEITVRDVVDAYLKEHDLDGLYNCEYECTCSREDMCCDNPYAFGDCHVAYKGWHKAEDEDDWEGIGYYGAIGDVRSPRTQPDHPRIEHARND